MQFRLRVPTNQLREYIGRYDYGADPRLAHLKLAAKQQGYLTRAQLYELALWKSQRRASLVHHNDHKLVREITRFAFAAKHEHTRIGTLTLLRGVHFPTASVILHFCVSRTYPILDYRALWSLGVKKPAAYSPEFWCEYTTLCRSVAKVHGLTVRELDMALWQYSRENQR